MSTTRHTSITISAWRWTGFSAPGLFRRARLWIRLRKGWRYFVLVRIKGKKKEWLLIKQKDEYAQSGWRLETSLTPEKRAELKECIPPCETS
jgi:hypothetical protein